MPDGTDRQKRPADVIGDAVKALGAKGGKTRATRLSPEKQSATARKAAAQR